MNTVQSGGGLLNATPAHLRPIHHRSPLCEELMRSPLRASLSGSQTEEAATRGDRAARVWTRKHLVSPQSAGIACPPGSGGFYNPGWNKHWRKWKKKKKKRDDENRPRRKRDERICRKVNRLLNVQQQLVDSRTSHAAWTS